LKVGLGENQVLFGGCYSTLGLGQRDGGEGADPDLFLVVGERLLGKLKGTLVDGHGLIGGHQVPVEIFNLGDSLNDLLAEDDIFDFAVISGNADPTQIGIETEALQQMLAQCEAK